MLKIVKITNILIMKLKVVKIVSILVKHVVLQKKNAHLVNQKFHTIHKKINAGVMMGFIKKSKIANYAIKIAILVLKKKNASHVI